ncbi:MAG: glycosyltransferase, partial [Alistipes sp.]|nr:glycosyltransferase [Alistipes sp.]
MHFFNQILEHYTWPGIALLAILLILFAVQLYYYAIAYRRIHRFRLMNQKDKYCENPYVSVIVAVRGEDEYFLSEQLPTLLGQSYDVYEIVVVYIGRDIDYYAELQRIRDQRSNMKLTKLGGNGRIYITTKQAY